MRFFRLDRVAATYGLPHERWVNAERVLELRVGQELGGTAHNVWGLVAALERDGPAEWEALYRHHERDACLEWVRDVLEELR